MQWILWEVMEKSPPASSFQANDEAKSEVFFPQLERVICFVIINLSPTTFSLKMQEKEDELEMFRFNTLP